MAILKRTRKDGSVAWQVLVDEWDAVTGKRKRHTVGTFTPKKRAQAEERKALEAIDDGTFVLRSPETVAELLDSWLASKKGRVRSGTLVGYRTAVENYWKPLLGGVAAQGLKEVHVQSAVNAWVDEGKYRTAQINLNVLSAACRYGISQRLMKHNPCEAVEAPSDPEPGERTIWTEAEVRQFMKHAEDDPLSLLWFLFLETGMRRGEALGLHWNNVNWNSSELLISNTAVQNKVKGEPTMRIQPMGKTDASARAILISAGLLSKLRKRRSKATTSVLVFSNARGQPLTPTWVRKKLDALCETAGVRRVTIHELRHIAATRMMRAGVPMVVAQQRMGHKSSDLLRKVYQHADAEAQRDAVAAIERLSALP